MEFEAGRDPVLPWGVAIRRPSGCRSPQVVQFGIGFRAVDEGGPTGWGRDGPILDGQEPFTAWGATASEAGPRPIFGMLDQVGP